MKDKKVDEKVLNLIFQSDIKVENLVQPTVTQNEFLLCDNFL